MPTRITTAIALAVLAAAACDRAAAPAPPAPAPAPAPAIAPATAPAPTPPAAPGLAGQMQTEAAHRSRAGVTAEALFAALDRAGVGLVDRTQYVGATMHAEYCAGGRTSDGNVVAICEYADDAAARAGLRYMNTTFDLPTATRTAHGDAVMTVVHQPGADAAVVDKAIAAFAAL